MHIYWELGSNVQWHWFLYLDLNVSRKLSICIHMCMQANGTFKKPFKHIWFLCLPLKLHSQQPRQPTFKGPLSMKTTCVSPSDLKQAGLVTYKQNNLWSTFLSVALLMFCFFSVLSCECVYDCGPAKDWWPVQGVPRLHPTVSRLVSNSPLTLKRMQQVKEDGFFPLYCLCLHPLSAHWCRSYSSRFTKKEWQRQIIYKWSTFPSFCLPPVHPSISMAPYDSNHL